jgi:hypothetical protein
MPPPSSRPCVCVGVCVCVYVCSPKNRMALHVKRYGHLLDVFVLDVLVVLVLNLEIESFELIACSCGILLDLGR